MKQNWNNIFGSVAAGFVLALISQLSTLNSVAELTATVSPGYTFSSTERVSTSALNRLGLPTITITGTLDGTNAGISAGSINANMFSSTVVDDATIEFTNSSPQALAIKAAGVGAREISSSIAGPGLTGGSGAILTNNVDGVTLLVTNDVVTLGTNAPSFLTVASNSVVVGTTNNQGWAMTPLQFATNVYPGLTLLSTVACSSISAPAKVIDVAHNFGVTPLYVRVVLECTTTDLGYAVGDEVELNSQNSGTVSPGNVWGNTTNAGYTCTVPAAQFIVANKTTGNFTTAITPARWNLKLIARP
jgi:hypothetical protein